MVMEQQMRERDLVLPPNTYSFVLDSTKGKVSVFVGPYKSSLSNTDTLVVWDDDEHRFEAAESLEDAIYTFVKAREGQYIVLADPAKGETDAHPPLGIPSDMIELAAGRKMIIPGPVSFPLWPGQVGATIDGHHLRSNQYLLVRVYEPEQAQKHARSAVVAPTTTTGTVTLEAGEERSREASAPVLDSRAYTMGQLRVIRGTDVSFYIPSTGLEVLPEAGQYVREAVTLERLEYCILLDEDGEKRYIEGPAVVFPEPTEQFITDDDANRKFKAIELNEQSALYIKVIAPYADDDVNHAAGEELFITGKTMPIYFPRPEHSIIYYGAQKKHHAIAIPKGEGRYVLDRNEGSVELVVGPNMFLPDPRHQVIVRRILDPEDVEVMYPGNDEAISINQTFVQQRKAQGDNQYLQANISAFNSMAAGASAATPDIATSGLMQRSAPSTSFVGDQVTRGTTYTAPRTITLDTKYEGAVSVNIWPGYAVLVTDKSGNRRVEAGPRAVLLQYDESLMTLSLSTGRPKTDDDLLRTVYLRTVNNQVSDQLTVETSDLVPVTIDLSYRVNFEGEADTKWFDIENYVQLLTDRCRSRLRNVSKRHDIKTFYANYIDIIRDALLGASPENGERVGLVFAENQMHLYDVEVRDAIIRNAEVNQLLTEATTASMTGAIKVSQAEDESRRVAQLEGFKRDTIKAIVRTEVVQHDAWMESLGRQINEELGKVHRDFEIAAAQLAEADQDRAEAKRNAEQDIELEHALDKIRLERMNTETDLFVKRLNVLQGGVVQALNEFGDKAFVEHLVQALGPVALAAGLNTSDILHQVFKDTPFESITGALSDRPFAANGHTELVADTASSN